LEKLRYSVEKKKIKDVLLVGQYKKNFIAELDNKKFKVSKLTLPDNFPITGFFAFFLPVYKNGFNSSKYSLCLACCFSLALCNINICQLIKPKP
jgi:membrane protein CcdC involved in cytochrome C biogenesis